MKTPIQELVDRFESSSTSHLKYVSFLAWLTDRRNREYIIEKEKQQIIEAYKMGGNFARCVSDNTKELIESSIEYYNETFNNNENTKPE